MRIILPLYFLLALCLTGCGRSTDPEPETFIPMSFEFSEPEITGALFYVDPVNGSMEGDGSLANPWRTVQEVIEGNLIESREYTEHPWVEGTPLKVKNQGAPVKAGDALILLDGYHGSLKLADFHNSEYITIRAGEGHSPRVSGIALTACAYWHIKGLNVSPSFGETFIQGTMASFISSKWQGPISNLILNACFLYSVEDVSKWTADDWNQMACNGISVRGDSVHILNNHVRNTNFGLTISGNNSIAFNNIIENFSGDGLRGLGNDLLFERNTVKNCYDVNDNHDDGFQSWSIKDDPPRERVTLRGNLIINYEDPNQPLRGALQGIGCFDGPFINWVVENNVVITDHWHGITLSGALSCRIVNNTVIDPNSQKPGPAWIRISNHKDGTPSENCLIRNNIAATISAGEGVTEDHNFLLKDPVALFKNRKAYDLRLIPHAPVIDSGSSDLAPETDFDGMARPQGEGIDIGAFEHVP